MNDKQIVKAWGSANARIRDGRLQTRASVDVRHLLDGKLQSVIQNLTTAALGLDDPSLDVESGSQWGDPCLNAVIYGWRDTPADEREKMVQSIEARKVQQADQDAALLRALRERRPDLF